MIRVYLLATAVALFGLSSAAMAQVSNCYASTPAGSAAALSNGIIGGFMQSSCTAPTGGAATGSRWDTRAFVGLAVSFGTGDYSSKGGVHLTAGVRRTNVSADNSVYGAELHGSINLLEWKDIQLRALGLFGNRDVLGNAGLGFDILKLTPLAVAGVQIPYARAFVDLYAFNWNVRGFAEVNTYGRIQPVQPSMPSCAADATLSNEQQAATAINNALFPFYSGGIMTGSVYNFTSNSFLPISGQPSSAWVNNQTCFKNPVPSVI